MDANFFSFSPSTVYTKLGNLSLFDCCKPRMGKPGIFLRMYNNVLKKVKLLIQLSSTLSAIEFKIMQVNLKPKNHNLLNICNKMVDCIG